MSQQPILELRSRVPPQAHGLVLIDYLLGRFPYHDRAAWLAELGARRVFVDGRVASPELVLRRGATLLYQKPHQEPEVNRRFTVLHTDAHIVVVDKPPHLPMHADGPFVQNTLIHLVREHLRAPELQLVHRLDRETSGVVVLARDAAVGTAIRSQFPTGAFQKTYIALVRGRVEAAFTSDRPIGRCRDSMVGLRRSAAADALEPKPARTGFVILGRGHEVSLMRCTPTTGRTHQIRVHLEAAGLPVLGDKLYGRPDADYLAFVQRVKGGGSPTAVPDGEPGRHLLHARELAFLHPASNQPVSFAAPLPADFAPWLTGMLMLADP